MDAQGNRGWVRSTSASRRALRVTNYVHISARIATRPNGSAFVIRPGDTFVIGSNAAKRTNRRAHIKARKASRKGR